MQHAPKVFDRDSKVGDPVLLTCSGSSPWHRTVRRPRGLMAREKKKSSLGGAAHSFAAVQVSMWRLRELNLPSNINHNSSVHSSAS